MENSRPVKLRGPLAGTRTFFSHFMFKIKRNERVDFLLFILVFGLLCFGLVMLFSASQNTSRENIYSIILRQSVWALIGLVMMFLTSRMDYHAYRRPAGAIFWVIMAVMVIVPVVGKFSHGATRQIDLGFVSFQPSEVCKFALVIYFAALLSSKKYNNLKDWHKVMRYIFILATVVVTCIAQSHLSAMLLILGVGLLMLIVAGLPWGYVAIMAGVIGGIGAIASYVTPYRMRRLLIFLDPFSDLRGDGWQIVNSLYAVGSGGLLGVGFGQSRQKYGYLPEALNDYIYAIVCEELGFVGGVVVLLLFALLIIRGMQISLSARDTFGTYLGFGIVAIVALQVIVNVGVVLSILPSTGMQLPFFSSGGTSLIIMMAGLGVLMNISRFTTKNKI